MARLYFQDEMDEVKAELEAARTEVALLQSELHLRTCERDEANACVTASAQTIARLRAALEEAMKWNWLDEDARPSPIADLCDAALEPTR